MNKLESVITILKKRKLSIAAAESCTGGYLSYLLTKTAGSSKVFKGAIVAYTPQIKNKLLKIPLSELKKTEGVSLKVSLLLAKNIKKSLNSDIGASVVGFAGPTTKKGIKVGTVFISIADKKGELVKKLSIKGNRDFVRKKASLALIDLIYKRLNKYSGL
ncbi:MAG: CinA family protein [Candidatus Omnitrophota bacterium]|nr:MAG: CinA family protein [Candidatus Omnitrophota bacterium]